MVSCYATWRERLFQLLRLFLVTDHQRVEEPRAADLELGVLWVFLYLNGWNQTKPVKMVWKPFSQPGPSYLQHNTAVVGSLTTSVTLTVTCWGQGGDHKYRLLKFSFNFNPESKFRFHLLPKQCSERIFNQKHETQIWLLLFAVLIKKNRLLKKSIRFWDMSSYLFYTFTSVLHL